MATLTLAHRASALFHMALKESTVHFSFMLMMTVCTRSVAVSSKRSGDCRVSDMNFTVQKRSSNKVKWRINLASVSTSSGRASVDLREFGCDLMSLKVAVMAGSFLHCPQRVILAQPSRIGKFLKFNWLSRRLKFSLIFNEKGMDE